MNKQDAIQLYGWVVPDEYDQYGNVIGLAIETDDFQRYIVILSENLDPLIQNLHQLVIVQGQPAGYDSRGYKRLIIQEVQASRSFSK